MVVSATALGKCAAAYCSSWVKIAGRTNSLLTLACAGLIDSRQAAPYRLSINCATGILEKSGSPMNSARSKNARRKASRVRCTAGVVRPPEFRQIVALKNIQDLDQCGSARRRRRRADDVVSAVRPAHRFTLFYFVLRQILNRDQASALLHGRGQFARHRSMIEVVRVGGDPFQRARQVWLLEHLTGFVIVPIALKDAPRLRKLRQEICRLASPWHLVRSEQNRPQPA